MFRSLSTVCSGIGFSHAPSLKIKFQRLSAKALRFPINKWSKRGSTCLCLPGPEPVVDLTVYMDISPNSGPRDAELINKLSNSKPNSPCFNTRSNLHTNQTTNAYKYSTYQLKALRWTSKLIPGQSTLLTCKTNNIFKYRGKRAGSSTYYNRQFPIRTLVNNRPVMDGFTRSSRRVNLNNLCYVKQVNQVQSKHTNNLFFVPSLGLSNVMSLAPKIDEVGVFLSEHNLDVFCVTETWLKDSISDNVINVNNYSIARKDRSLAQHGGVCIYIKNSINYTILREYEDPNSAEVLWVKLTPNRLPRGYSCLVVGVIYHPPTANDQILINYLLDALSRIECSIPNAGFILAGDFNRADISQLTCQFHVCQMVPFPTRGERILDLVLTNLVEFYDVPKNVSPFGLSDHCTIGIFPKCRVKQSCPTRKTVKTRDLKPSSKQAFGRYLA